MCFVKEKQGMVSVRADLLEAEYIAAMHKRTREDVDPASFIQSIQ